MLKDCGLVGAEVGSLELAELLSPNSSTSVVA